MPKGFGLSRVTAVLEAENKIMEIIEKMEKETGLIATRAYITSMDFNEVGVVGETKIRSVTLDVEDYKNQKLLWAYRGQ